MSFLREDRRTCFFYALIMAILALIAFGGLSRQLFDADDFELLADASAAGQDLSLLFSADRELPGRPADQPFWISSTSGAGPQELIWEIEDGTYSIVVMNDDASDGLSFETRIGARVPLLKPIGTGLLVGGSVAVALGALLVALAVF